MECFNLSKKLPIPQYKLQWRLNALKAKNSLDAAKKRKSRQSFKHMSSEDEKQSGDKTVIVVKSLPWRLPEFKGILKELDEKSKTLTSGQSKRQEIRRVRRRSPSARSKPSQITKENS
ncbi:hypothetical protein KUTeg_018691 [Tegillarca granosa]|uniref:Uncharacterized protein n=1 Tax=Tegillarca granosa TaxID=220873 RepID=A0ABQ9EEN9_TEGGR|nr:hypothetical protein KUTeg_018691 [Tegillarca granosa]